MTDLIRSILVRSMLTRMEGVRRSDDGQTLAEYALILAGVAVVVMGVVWLLGDAIAASMQSLVDQF